MQGLAHCLSEPLRLTALILGRTKNSDRTPAPSVCSRLSPKVSRSLRQNYCNGPQPGPPCSDWARLPNRNAATGPLQPFPLVQEYLSRNDSLCRVRGANQGSIQLKLICTPTLEVYSLSPRWSIPNAVPSSLLMLRIIGVSTTPQSTPGVPCMFGRNSHETSER
ncbi:hypothetical protein N657DRAFT_641182 [Parathielavia appendiculata]|uniref:Uncharacterized protein n=1 Tax=Parathielavia appendiculata TaxID=2587402 RepID=A0AAN6U7D4_9PEZI|nr:hypothetical protein N657DRAFT_641182 [Parathielavia appendiculata]